MAQPRSSRSRKATTFTQDGIYKKGQRLIHPKLGLGTVVKVRWGKVVMLMDADVHIEDDAVQRKSKRRVFLAAKLDVVARPRANGLKDYQPPRIRKFPKKSGTDLSYQIPPSLVPGKELGE